MKSETLLQTSWKDKPFEHQKDILPFHLSQANTLDNSDVGAGKTAPMVTYLQEMYQMGAIRTTLIICPNSILENWQAEINRWSDLSSAILRGTKAKRLKLLSQPAKIYLINYEGIRVIHKELMEYGFDCVVCDEIHHIKSYKGSYNKPTQAFLARELGRVANYRKGMTGTLLTNSLMDLWSIAKFISPVIFNTNFWGYRSRYMYDVNAGKPWAKWPDWQPKPGAAEEIKQLLAPYVIRFEKKDVLKFLPPVLFQKRMVDLSMEQDKALKELKRHFLTELDDGHILTAAHIGPRVQKLLEIENGFVYREGESTYRFKQNPKLKELKALLEEIGNQRVVIWTTFKEEINIIAGALQVEEDLSFSNGKGAILTGDTPSEERQSIVNHFNRNKYQYLITNAAVGGEGIDLFCPYAIYYSRGHKLIHRLQSLGRHDRPGAEQFENLTMIDIVARGGLDEKVFAALESKKDLLKSITPETFRRMIQ